MWMMVFLLFSFPFEYIDAFIPRPESGVRRKFFLDDGRSLTSQQHVMKMRMRPCVQSIHRPIYADLIAAAVSFQLLFGGPMLESFYPKSAFAIESREQVSSIETVDEAWTLLSQFYIDKGFNGQDWDKVI